MAIVHSYVSHYQRVNDRFGRGELSELLLPLAGLKRIAGCGRPSGAAAQGGCALVEVHMIFARYIDR